MLCPFRTDHQQRLWIVKNTGDNLSPVARVKVWWGTPFMVPLKLSCIQYLKKKKRPLIFKALSWWMHVLKSSLTEFSGICADTGVYGGMSFCRIWVQSIKNNCLYFIWKICYIRMLWGQTLRSQVPYSGSIQLHLYVWQSSLYRIFLFSWSVCLYFVPVLHHIWFEQYTTYGKDGWYSVCVLCNDSCERISALSTGHHKKSH